MSNGANALIRTLVDAGITDPVPAGTTFVSANMGGTASFFSSAPGYDGVDTGAMAPVTLTLNTSLKDTWINGAATTFNYGTATTLAVNRSGPQRSLVQFDLSSIPIGSTVTSATLTLNATAVNGSNPIEVHRVSPTAVWTEGTANGAAPSWQRDLTVGGARVVPLVDDVPKPGDV